MVYAGRDIRTGTEVAVKIGLEDNSMRLRHENQVYTSVGGSAGISAVRRYGKEGQYEVLVLDHLGTSLDKLINGQEINHERIFQYASQMVCSSRK